MKPLPYRVRAELFLQLWRLEQAGLPYDRAAAAMRLPSPAARRLKAMQALASRGIDAARAGEQSGLFTRLEARLVRAAIVAGSPAAVYQRLAEHYSQRARQLGAIKARLVLPAAVLAIALVVEPLPALVSGAIAPKGYAWQVAWPVLAIAAVVAVVRWLGVPLYRPILVRTNLRDFFESLAMMLEAGVPLLEALPAAIDTIGDRDVRRELTRARQRVEKRASFAAALKDVPCLRGSPAIELAQTGEESGTLPEMLMRYAAIETAAIGQFHEQVAAWLPRFVYLLVAIKVAVAIFALGGLAPKVPADL